MKIDKEKKDIINFEKKAEVKKELMMVRSERKIRGLALFEINKITKEIKLAEFIQRDFILDFTKPNPAKDLLGKIKVKLNINCVYIQAINKRNALKKFNKQQ